MRIVQTVQNDLTELDIQNGTGLCLRLCSLGASIRSVSVPDKEGVTRCVTLCPTDEKIFREKYFGKTIGRTAGRTPDAAFTIGNKTAHLEKNNCGHDNLHGGASGFHAQNFAVTVRENADYSDVVFSRTSPDGEGGYFGTVQAAVTYRIYEKKNEFRLLFDATADTATLLNLTNHVYWNVGGDLRENVRNQTLYLAASRVAEMNERLIVQSAVPVLPAFDFRTPHRIGEYIDTPAVQKDTGGYDHVFFLDTAAPSEPACIVHSAVSGIQLTVGTTYPCVVFYSDSAPIEGMDVGFGKTDEKFLAACFECQYNSAGIIQSPEHCGILSPDRPYHEEIRYEFSVK